MRDVYEILREKELQIERVKTEVEAAGKMRFRRHSRDERLWGMLVTTL